MGRIEVSSFGRTSRSASRSLLAPVTVADSNCFCDILVAKKLKSHCFLKFLSKASISLLVYFGGWPFWNGWLSKVDGQRKVIKVRSSNIFGFIFFCVDKYEGGGKKTDVDDNRVIWWVALVVSAIGVVTVCTMGDDGLIQMWWFGASIKRIVNM